jgi:hypothetical protein
MRRTSLIFIIVVTIAPLATTDVHAQSSAARTGDVSPREWLDHQLFSTFLERSNGTRPEPRPARLELSDGLRRMFRRSGSGFWQEEQAAWILMDSDGPLLVLWPWSGERRRATWRGPPPEGAVAQIHTHGMGQQAEPSVRGTTNDHEAARACDLPVYVLSRDAIWKVTPEPLVESENPVRVVEGTWWKKGS